MSSSKTKRAAVLVGLTAILLVGMAVLQYRWVGELSEFEYQRTQRTLRASTEGLTRDFEREFRRIRSAFEIRRSRESEREIEQEYGEWVDSADFPELIAEIYWLERESTDPTLRRFDFADGRLKSAEWTPLLMPLRESMIASTQGGRNRQRQGRTWIEPLDGNSMAMVISQEDRRFPVWAIVLLNRDVLIGRMFSAMVDRYFGSREERDYDIWLAEEGSEGPPIYASNLSVPPAAMTDADVSRDIDDIDWVVAVRHQAGSLEAFVSQYRRRNLLLGVGTVIVLGASFAFLLLATRRAQGLAERQMEFVAGVSHELRTPIAGISSLSQNLADGVVRDPAHVAHYGESINAESRRLQDMVEKVLHFSAVRSGQHRYNMQAIDLPSIVERELETFERYRSGRAPLVLTVEGDVPPVLGDEQALRTVVRNLVSNAIKFGSAESPVTISARRAPSSGRQEIELRVQDHGEGIVASDLPHIFDPFYRGKGVSAAQVGGSGLGLSLVREIVKAHHGRIEVTTLSGEGSIFRVYLPIASPQES